MIGADGGSLRSFGYGSLQADTDMFSLGVFLRNFAHGNGLLQRQAIFIAKLVTGQ